MNILASIVAKVLRFAMEDNDAKEVEKIAKTTIDAIQQIPIKKLLLVTEMARS